MSPFMDMDSSYRFRLNMPGERLMVGINQHDADGPLFNASLTASRVEFNDANLVRLFFTRPLVTFKVIVGIHWQALRLWRRGARFHRRPEPAPRSLTIVTRRGVLH